MTLEKILIELEKLNIDFVLVTQRRVLEEGEVLNDEVSRSLSTPEVHLSSTLLGEPQHPSVAAAFLCQGIQRLLNLCDKDFMVAAKLSRLTGRLSARLEEWYQTRWRGH